MKKYDQKEGAIKAARKRLLALRGRVLCYARWARRPHSNASKQKQSHPIPSLHKKSAATIYTNTLMARLGKLRFREGDVQSERKIKLIEDKKTEIKKEVLTLSKRHKEIESAYNNLITKESFIKAFIEKNKKLIYADRKTFFLNSKDYLTWWWN